MRVFRKGWAKAFLDNILVFIVKITITLYLHNSRYSIVFYLSKAPSRASQVYSSPLCAS